jgi:hypothetical protein
VVQASTAPAEGRTKTGAAAASEAERAVPSSAKAPHKYVVGDKVLVLDQFISKKTKMQKTKWRKASVLQAEGGKVEIHFDGWSEKWNFWLDLNVPGDRKRLALCATSSDTTLIVGGSSMKCRHAEWTSSVSFADKNIVRAVPAEGDAALRNADEIAGNVVAIVRGACPFTDKVQRAVDAGAVGVIVINNDASNPNEIQPMQWVAKDTCFLFLLLPSATSNFPEQLWKIYHTW